MTPLKKQRVIKKNSQEIGEAEKVEDTPVKDDGSLEEPVLLEKPDKKTKTGKKKVPVTKQVIENIESLDSDNSESTEQSPVKNDVKEEPVSLEKSTKTGKKKIETLKAESLAVSGQIDNEIQESVEETAPVKKTRGKKKVADPIIEIHDDFQGSQEEPQKKKEVKKKQRLIQLSLMLSNKRIKQISQNQKWPKQ